MSMLGKLVGVGLVAAAAVVATKAAKKYLSNQEDLEVLAHGVELDDDAPAQDSRPRPSSFEAVAHEAREVMHDAAYVAEQHVQCAKEQAAEKITASAQSAGIDTEQLSESFADAGRALADAGKAVWAAGSVVAQKVAQDAPGVINKVKTQTGDWLEQMKGAVNTAYDRTPDADKPHTNEAGRPDDDSCK